MPHKKIRDISLISLSLIALIMAACSSTTEDRVYLGQKKILGNSCTTTTQPPSEINEEPLVPPPPIPESQTQIIFAAQTWQAFPMTVEAGDLIQIESTGEWNGGQGWCGAEGCNGSGPFFDSSSSCYAENDCVIGRKNLLIMKIVHDEDRLESPDNAPQMGENFFKETSPIRIAKDYESLDNPFEVTESGRLYFRNSDGSSPSSLGDNSGGLYVTVTKR